MAQHPHRTSSQDSTVDGIRKRVCKACDRCRLKKSKCDGANPCSRCKADNAICVFGERKKSHDKVYPKGYVEMLEQQQSQLVAGLQEMYRRLQSAQAWEGPALPETNGNPLTHDILAALNLLETKHDGSGDVEGFEEDVQKLQSKLIAEGAGYVQRRGSFSSDSEHSHHGHDRSASHGTPTLSRPTLFKENFNFGSATSSPMTQSPVPRPRVHHSTHAMPVQSPTFNNDPQLFQPEWPQNFNGMSMPEAIMRSKFALQVPELDNSPSNVEDILTSAPWEQSPPPTSSGYDNSFGLAAFTQQFGNPFAIGGLPMDPLASVDAMDLEFNKYVQPNEIMT